MHLVVIFAEPPADERAFFEIAATLIPLLLFGGVVIDRTRPPARSKWTDRHDFVGMVFVLVGGVAVWAETIAIGGVITGSATTLSRVFVSVVLLGGMVLVIVAIAAPWFSRMRETVPRGLGLGTALIAGAMLLTFVFAASAVLREGTALTLRKERREAYEKAIKENSDERGTVKRRLEFLEGEMRRTDAQLAIAKGHHDPVAASAVAAERATLTALLGLTRDQHRRLREKSTALEREARGESVHGLEDRVQGRIR
jgi:hypothetical protein